MRTRSDRSQIRSHSQTSASDRHNLRQREFTFPVTGLTHCDGLFFFGELERQQKAPANKSAGLAVGLP